MRSRFILFVAGALAAILWGVFGNKLAEALGYMGTQILWLVCFSVMIFAATYEPVIVNFLGPIRRKRPAMFIVGSAVLGAIVCGAGTYLIERNFKETLTYSYYSVFFNHNSKPTVKNGEYMIQRYSKDVVEAITILPHPAGMTTYQTDGGPTDPYNKFQNKRSDNITIPKGTASFSLYFSDGEREIDFATKQGNWYERWKISTNDKGDVEETIMVLDALPNGNVLYEDSRVNGISTRQRGLGILDSLIRAVS